MRHELFVVGVGPGSGEHLTMAAAAVLTRVSCVVAAPRHMSLASGHPNVLPLKGFSETAERIEDELKSGSVALMVSGDPGIFSLLPWLRKNCPNLPVRVIPGISSLQSLCASVGETWDDIAILSGHGKTLPDSRLLRLAEQKRLSVVFCGSDYTPRRVCEILAANGLGGSVEIIVGERLSYPDERISRGTPDSFTSRDFDGLSVLLIRNESPFVPPFGRPKDADFERGDVPMTREEVRSVILDRLELKADSVLWDIGSGTGSVSVAAALSCIDGEVHSVERLPEALELVEKNRKKFRLHNMFIHSGSALDVIETLPQPTHVFIGGHGGELGGILKHVSQRGSGIRILVATVTLETLSEASALLSGDSYTDFEAVQISVSVSKLLGKSRIMSARNPVTLLAGRVADPAPDTRRSLTPGACN